MSGDRDAVLAGHVRTPFGKADPQRGRFRDARSDDLAAVVLQEILHRIGLPAGEVDGVIVDAVEMMSRPARPRSSLERA